MIHATRPGNTLREPGKIDVYLATVNLAEGALLQAIATRELLDDLENAAGRLRRVAFQAHFALGYTLQEIADDLGIGKGAVRYQIGEAVKFLAANRHRYWPPA